MGRLAWLLIDPEDGERTIIFRDPSKSERDRYILKQIVYFIVEL